MAAVCETLALLIPPSFIEFWRERGRDWGPIAAGALFGGGVWIWGDAVATSSTKVPFDRYIPGILAAVALLMINTVRYDQLHEYDPFDDGGGVCRSRFWLFLSYLVSFAALTGSVWVLLQHYAFAGGTAWTGVAGVLEVALILASALVFFLSRTPVDGAGGGYGAAGYSEF
jgi:hypothetical protein